MCDRSEASLTSELASWNQGQPVRMTDTTLEPTVSIASPRQCFPCPDAAPATSAVFCAMDGYSMKMTTIVSAILMSLAANFALAAGGDDQGQNNRWQQNDQRRGERVRSAPEIDPSQAMGALVLLGGTLAIIRGYRRKK